MKKLYFLMVLLVIFIPLTACKNNDEQNIGQDMLTSYNMTIQVNCEEKTLQGAESVIYVNNSSESLDKIAFHLYPNAFKEQNGEQQVVSEYNFEKAYPNGFDSGYIDILSVVDNSGVELEYKCNDDSNILFVMLNTPVSPKNTVEIGIDFFVKIPNVLHRFGYGENTINVGNFYPIVCVYENGDFVCDGYHYNGDPFYSEMANYSATITYDNSYTIGTSGQDETIVEGTSKISTINQSHMRDFAFILSQKYVTKMIDCNKGKTTCSYLFYDDSDYEQTLQLIAQAVDTFSSIIGAYPYNSLMVAKSNFLHGGMEYPLLVFISDAPMKKEEYYRIIVHEIAHQWFYNLIGNNEYSEAWLDEGLTEYATLLFFEENEEYGIDYSEQVGSYLSSYQMFVDIYTDVFGEIDTSMNRPLHAYTSEPEYTYCVYIKGVLMLDDLRSHIGDSAFMLGLKNYYQQNVYKIAKQEQFVLAFQKVSNKNIAKIIQSWIEGSVILQKIS